MSKVLQFVFTLFNLQGTVSSLFAVALASAANCFILTHRFEFVKNFFQVFSNSFRCESCSRLSPFITQLFKFITFTRTCQELFSFLFNFFLGRALSGADSFDRIPNSVAFVKNFFQVFLNFFRRALSGADSFGRIPNLPPFVNTFFQVF